MKKRIQMIAGIAALGMLASAMTGCGAGGANGAISVITREDGSGTRGAFTELCGIVADDKDNTVSSAEVTNSTAVMLTTVAGNSAAIGYVSMSYRPEISAARSQRLPETRLRTGRCKSAQRQRWRYMQRSGTQPA